MKVCPHFGCRCFNSPLVVEELGTRFHLSVTLRNGTLRIYTDSAADHISFGRKATQPQYLRVDVNGELSKFRVDRVSLIYINSEAGDDSINLGSLPFRANFVSGEGDDWISGGSTRDTIVAGHGNDTIFGNAGNDDITKHGGNGLIDGGAGDDRIILSTGNDTALGGAGNDRIFAGVGNDSLIGGAGNDIIDAGDGADTIIGEDGNDVLGGSDGYDFVSGGAGDDSIDGGDGIDRIFGGVGADGFGSRGKQNGRLDFSRNEGDFILTFSYGGGSSGGIVTSG